MNKNCKNLRQKLNRKLYCHKLKKEIKILECSNCKYKEYLIKSNSTKLEKKTYKQTKLERNRFSILTNAFFFEFFNKKIEFLTIFKDF